MSINQLSQSPARGMETSPLDPVKTVGEGKGLKINRVILPSQPTGPGAFTVSSLRSCAPDQQPGLKQRMGVTQGKHLWKMAMGKYQDAMNTNFCNGLKK